MLDSSREHDGERCSGGVSNPCSNYVITEAIGETGWVTVWRTPLQSRWQDLIVAIARNYYSGERNCHPRQLTIIPPACCIDTLVRPPVWLNRRVRGEDRNAGRQFLLPGNLLICYPELLQFQYSPITIQYQELWLQHSNIMLRCSASDKI